MKRSKPTKRPTKTVFIREPYITAIVHEMAKAGVGRSAAQTAHVLIVAGAKALKNRSDIAAAIVEAKRASEEARLDFEHPIN